jgi:hypothetical protein
MKIIVRASGTMPLERTYFTSDNIAHVPSVGDTVMWDGTPLEVYERVFDFEKKPSEVNLLCRAKS